MRTLLRRSAPQGRKAPGGGARVRRRALAACGGLFLAACLLAGCGGTRTVTRTVDSLTAPPAVACPQAVDGHGFMGICAPKSELGIQAPRSSVAPGAPTWPDRSNNDPCYCGAQIKANGYRGLVVKANQGVGFIDRTAVPMVQSARRAGLAVGMYDFDADYSIAEADVFVRQAKLAGIYPHTKNTFPLYFDVEWGAFSLRGLVAQIVHVHAMGYRVGIYTGAWYWGPHAGCTWVGVTGWLSGYPVAPVPCGMPIGLFAAHQFTSTPVDLTVFRGSVAQFRAFVNAGPPVFNEKPFLIYPAAKVKLYGQHISERNTVEQWWRHHCANPVRRTVCKTTRQHLEWLHGRLRQLAYAQDRPADIGNPITDWSTGKRGKRYARIGRILASHAR